VTPPAVAKGSQAAPSTGGGSAVGRPAVRVAVELPAGQWVAVRAAAPRRRELEEATAAAGQAGPAAVPGRRRRQPSPGHLRRLSTCERHQQRALQELGDDPERDRRRHRTGAVERGRDWRSGDGGVHRRQQRPAAAGRGRLLSPLQLEARPTTGWLSGSAPRLVGAPRRSTSCCLASATRRPNTATPRYVTSSAGSPPRVASRTWSTTPKTRVAGTPAPRSRAP